jgi:hypothetical protein
MLMVAIRFKSSLRENQKNCMEYFVRFVLSKAINLGISLWRGLFE